MKKKTQRLRVPVTMALLENWPVPIRPAPAGSTRAAKKSTTRIIRIARAKEQVRRLAAQIFARTHVVL
jgi:hypothetical protein